MKLFNMTHQRSTSKALLFAIGGLSSITIAALIIILDPIQIIVNYKLSMRRGSFLFELWEKPPLDVFISVYCFNVTNYDRFIKGIDKKLKLDEVGPYVYQEFLTNNNAVFNDDNTLTFNPKRRVEFIRDKSVGDPKFDMILAPNIPYMGVTTAAADISIFAALAIRTLMKTLNSKVLLNISVHDYLWGYEDNLVKIASKLIPSIIHFEQFGILDRMFDEGDNTVTINLPKKPGQSIEHLEDMKPKSSYEYDYGSFDPVIRDYSIESWNGKKGFSDWGYRDGGYTNTECNTLRGTYEGTLFPRNITKGETFRIYRKAFCRTLPIVYSHPGSINGIDAFYFKLDEKAFDSNIDDPQSACFCKRDVCLKRGLGKITPCYYNIPTAVSFPHFYNADPSLLNNLEGLNPSEEKHGTEIVIQPQLGVPMKVHSRFQLNLLMGDIKFNTDMRPFENTVLPILWLEIAVESLTPELIFLLQILYNISPYIQTGAIVIMFAAGVALLAFASLLIISLPKPIKPIKPIESLNEMIKDFDTKREIRRYSDIYLFPLMKKDLLKYEEDEEIMQALTQVQDDDDDS